MPLMNKWPSEALISLCRSDLTPPRHVPVPAAVIASMSLSCGAGHPDDVSERWRGEVLLEDHGAQLGGVIYWLCSAHSLSWESPRGDDTTGETSWWVTLFPSLLTGCFHCSHVGRPYGLDHNLPQPIKVARTLSQKEMSLIHCMKNLVPLSDLWKDSDVKMKRFARGSSAGSFWIRDYQHESDKPLKDGYL